MKRRKPVIQEILDSMPWIMREKAKEKVREVLRERPPLTGQAFVDMWNRCVQEKRK